MINEFVEKAQFPKSLLPEIRSLNIFEKWLKAPHGSPFSTGGIGASIAELARIDAGLATFLLVQWGLAMSTIELLGSEDQKRRFLPRMKSIEAIAGWGLTEPLVGSDASSLTTSVKETADGFVINGEKRWIGNGDGELLIVWARNEDSQQVEGFIVETRDNGVTATAIKHKLALRMVQNCDIKFKDTKVPKENRLAVGRNFQEGTAVILKHSRVFVCWMAAGIAQGVYDHALRYTSQRRQFGRSVSGYQMVQEKLMRALANTQAIFLTCFRISSLVDQGQASMGQIALAKAFTSERLREVARIGREVMGGNGMLMENYAIKAIGDAEVVYTYEGTYDINMLVAGR